MRIADIFAGFPPRQRIFAPKEIGAVFGASAEWARANIRSGGIPGFCAAGAGVCVAFARRADLIIYALERTRAEDMAERLGEVLSELPEQLAAALLDGRVPKGESVDFEYLFRGCGGARWFSPTEAGKILGISGEQARRLAKSGAIKSMSFPGAFGERVKIHREDLMDFLRRHSNYSAEARMAKIARLVGKLSPAERAELRRKAGL